MLKHRSFCLAFHPYITYIKRFSALDASTAFTTTTASSPAPRRIFHKQQKKREPPFIAKDFTNKSQITSATTALTSLPTTTTTTNQRKEEHKFDNKFEGTYHFHRRFLCDSIHKEHIVNKFEWIRLSRVMKAPYSNTQRLFIQNLFRHHSPTYIRSLFQIWGICMKDINKYSNKKIDFDSIYLQILSNNADNKESTQIMLIMFHKLLYEQQIQQKKVIPLNEIVHYINDVYYSYHNLYRHDKDRNQSIKSNIIKILQSFRQFVVHQYKDIDERDKIEFDLTQKNPVISIWSHIGNILQIDTEQEFKQNKYLKKDAKFAKLQDTLIQNDFYSVICVMYHIFGVAKNFNAISMQDQAGDHAANMDLTSEENKLFIPMNAATATDKISMDEHDIILRLDSNVINILNENKLLANNIAVILNKLEKNHNKYIFKSKTNIEIDGVWSIYNNVQNENDLSLMVLPRAIFKIISAINNRNDKRRNVGSGSDNLFAWLGVNICPLPPRKDNIYNLDFSLITLAGEVANRRKLWFLLCYLPCSLGSNFLKNDALNVLCWLSSAIKGWEFELEHFKETKDQYLFEYYCSEYRRIIRDILNCYFREELIAEKGELLISRLAYIYLNDLLPNKWLNEDWFILAKLCPKIIINNEEYAGIKELNGLIFLRESLKKLEKTNTKLNDFVFKLKLLINDKHFVMRISKSLSGNHDCYIEFLESLCDEKDKHKESNIVDSNAIHLFMQYVLLPCADFISAFNLLKFMIKYEITMNINTIALFINICEHANNSNIMYDVYGKLYQTLGDKISNNPQILKSILRMFVKDNKWVWINEIIENIYKNNDNNDGIVALQKCYVQLIDMLVVLTKNENNNNIVDRELVSNLLVDVFNENKYENALKKLLIKTFEEYKQYLYNNNTNKDNKVMNDKYIVYKMNVLQELIAKSTNKHLLQHWDQLIVKLRKI